MTQVRDRPQPRPSATALADVQPGPLPPAGFAVGGWAAGIKRSGRPDVAVIVPRRAPAAVAAVFTTNRAAAAPVRLSRRHLAASDPGGDGRTGWTDGVVATSGCANAGTGVAGDRDQQEVAEILAGALGTRAERTLALSTGLIGTRLPLPRVRAGIEELLANGLGDTAEHYDAAADGLLTTDTRRKIASVEIELPDADGQPVAVRVCGLAKGVGMMHPRMATMLSVVLTDASADPATLYGILAPAAARTWNQVTVDGDTSTNDTVFLLVSGAAGAAPATPGSAARDALADAVERVARSLARQQAADGEGASTLLTCQVSGARDDPDARAVARAVVASSLVKAAVHGRDPNWGRILAAAGNATLPDASLLVAAGMDPSVAEQRRGRPAEIDQGRLAITVAGTPVFSGEPLAFDAQEVGRAMVRDEVVVRLDLGLGDGTGEAFGCDLTEEYVVENSAYST